MILVAVGSSQFPFDRLLRSVEALNGGETLVVQHGPSSVRPAGARCVSFLPFDELEALVREARIVVTHAGVGSILLALTHGKRPFVVPRRRGYGETVDDHQVESARRFASARLVTLVEEPAGLADAVARDNGQALSLPDGEAALAVELRSYLAAVVGRAAS